MKAIVCGAGQVGYAIARRLAAEQNDVIVIDQQPQLIQRVNDTLDVRGMVGFASHPDVLEQAGAEGADLVVAVTHSDEVNMVACQVAHSLFSVPTKIARVRDQSYLAPGWRALFQREHLPIDVIISPEIEVAKAVLRRLEVPGTTEMASFADDRVRLVGVVCQAECPVVDTPLRQLTGLFPDLNIVVVGIVRDERMIAPGGDDQMLVGDEVFFVADARHVRRALALFGHEEKEARRVVIVGGGNIGLYLATELERHHSDVRVRVIEVEKARAEAIADKLERSVVINGDALDREILLEANVQNSETIVAVTDDDEANILASLLAKKSGCARAVTLINNVGYAALIASLGIDASVNPRAITISTILQHVRRGRIRSVHTLRDGMAEVVEAEALETSGLIGRPLRDARLPSGVVVGAVVREDDVIIPRGDTTIQAKDRVVLFALAEAVRKVEKLFSVRLDFV